MEVYLLRYPNITEVVAAIREKRKTPPGVVQYFDGEIAGLVSVREDDELRAAAVLSIEESWELIQQLKDAIEGKNISLEDASKPRKNNAL